MISGCIVLPLSYCWLLTSLEECQLKLISALNSIFQGRSQGGVQRGPNLSFGNFFRKKILLKICIYDGWDMVTDTLSKPVQRITTTMDGIIGQTEEFVEKRCKH